MSGQIVPIFFDLETTVKGGPKGDSPEAHWYNNSVLLCGHRAKYGVDISVHKTTNFLLKRIENLLVHGKIPLLVAHNAKFDIKYLMRERPDLSWELCKVWDTMTFEYRDSGHRDQFMSLEDACTKRGVPFKKSLDLGGLLAQGVSMEDIPMNKLEATSCSAKSVVLSRSASNIVALALSIPSPFNSILANGNI